MRCSPGLRTLFLAPGILGDEPRLANLRAALRRVAHCVTLDLPELDAPLEVIESLEATAALLAARVQERQPHGPISIGGYSYGGFLAQQISTVLERAGRQVDGLYLFDPIPPLARRIDALSPPGVEAPAIGVKALANGNSATSGSRFVRRPGESWPPLRRKTSQLPVPPQGPGKSGAARALALRSWSRMTSAGAQYAQALTCSPSSGAIHCDAGGPRPARHGEDGAFHGGAGGKRIDYSVFWQRLCPHLSVEHLGQSLGVLRAGAAGVDRRAPDSL